MQKKNKFILVGKDKSIRLMGIDTCGLVIKERL